MEHCPDHADLRKTMSSKKLYQSPLSEQPKMANWLASGPSIDPLQTDLREDGLDADEKKDAIEPSCEVGGRDEKKTSRYEDPSCFVEHMICVNEMFDHFF